MSVLFNGREYNPRLHIGIEAFCTGVIEFLVSSEGWQRAEAETAVHGFIADEGTIAQYDEGLFANPMSCVNFARRYQMELSTFEPVFPEQFSYFHEMIDGTTKKEK